MSAMEGTMKFGIGLPNYGKTSTFDGIRRAALAAEQLGYDSVWTTDHIIVPEENIDPYGRIFESLTTLAMVAMLTQRVKLGASVLVLPMRNPILAAKQIATIDVASGGRMIVGLGVGWNEKEYQNLHANFHNRGKRLDEDIQLLRALWSNENVTFHGKYTQLDHAMSAPLPTQDGRPQRGPGGLPIWIGGNGESAWRRAAQYGDGWHATGPSPEQVAEGAKRIHELNPNKRLTISARLSIDFNPNTSPTYQYRGNTRYRLNGAPAAIRTRLAEYRQAGAEMLALVFPDDPAVRMAQIEQFAKEIMGGF
jgi:probable F420-dependent oxidoreductase